MKKGSNINKKKYIKRLSTDPSLNRRIQPSFRKIRPAKPIPTLSAPNRLWRTNQSQRSFYGPIADNEYSLTRLVACTAQHIQNLAVLVQCLPMHAAPSLVTLR